MCAVYVADQNSVTFFYESGTYGTALDTGSRISGLWIGLVTDHSPTEEENVTKIFYTGTTDRNHGQQINTQKDFEGWVQERGLYFPNDWAPEFTPILGMHDTNYSQTKGSLLVANYGKGYYIYTGLSFFRELPAGVPGAYRLFANLLSIGK